MLFLAGPGKSMLFWGGHGTEAPEAKSMLFLAHHVEKSMLFYPGPLKKHAFSPPAHKKHAFLSMARYFGAKTACDSLHAANAAR
jgi:hypothetical protein